MSAAYRSGTAAVAVVLGAAAALVLVLARPVADAIDRDSVPAGLLAAVSLVSLAAALLAAVVPGAWRVVCLGLATLPLLWVVSVVARTA